ncbi:MAG: hypothetical protein QOC59_1846 [Microbacteriaceae bacterium]|nr:hypothetical protein [Microbacteriaceae bacterium]
MAHREGLLDMNELRRRGIDRPDRLPPGSVVERLRRGVYAEAERLASLTETGRYRVAVLAAAKTLRPGVVFSHESAAVLLGLPVLAAWPRTVHLIDDRRTGGRSQLDVVRHCLGLEHAHPQAVDGVLTTSPARTVYDLAVGRSFPSAVVTADAALARYAECRGELAALTATLVGTRGQHKAVRVAAFADGLAGSPGESLSRVLMDRFGFVRPVLQFAVRTGRREEFTDFAWPDEGAAGEFDGEVKYREDRYRLGGTPEDVVIREKNRENRIRAVLPRFARWDWRDLQQPERLRATLLRAGVPLAR